MSGDLRLKNIFLVPLAIKYLKNWPTYFHDLFGRVNEKEITYILRNDIKFKMRAKTTDRGTMTTVVFRDDYGIKEANLDENSVVIDVGGNIGLFSVMAAKKAGKVYVYEPMPENYKYLEKNLNLNNIENVEPYQVAVSDKEGKAKLYISDINLGAHSIYGEGNSIKIKTTTLKSIFDNNDIEHCDFLKIDTEGGEYPALYSLPDDYFKKIKTIRMETHDLDDKKNNTDALIEFLKEKGFEIKDKRPIIWATRKD